MSFNGSCVINLPVSGS